MDSLMKFKSEFDNLISKIKLPGEVSRTFFLLSFLFKMEYYIKHIILLFLFFLGDEEKNVGDAQWLDPSVKQTCRILNNLIKKFSNYITILFYMKTEIINCDHLSQNYDNELFPSFFLCEQQKSFSFCSWLCNNDIIFLALFINKS